VARQASVTNDRLEGDWGVNLTVLAPPEDSNYESDHNGRLDPQSPGRFQVACLRTKSRSPALFHASNGGATVMIN